MHGGSARGSNIAYQDKDTIRPACSKLGLTGFAFLSKDDTEGFVASNDDVIVVAFRGTEPAHLQDLMSDARVHKVDGPFGQVHRGFLAAHELVRKDMFTAMEECRNVDKPQSIWLTGHSLGAALAVIAAAHLLKAGENVHGVYTYGQPRVGDAVFADEFIKRLGRRHFRFVNNNDTVTRVPPRSFGYSHHGDLRYIDADGDISEDPGRWSRFLDRISGRIEDFLDPGTDGIKDHSMARYEKHIASSIGRGSQRRRRGADVGFDAKHAGFPPC